MNGLEGKISLEDLTPLTAAAGAACLLSSELI